MSFLDRLLGRSPTPPPPPARRVTPAADPDQVAVERYRYLLRTAPPDQLEQAHVEAFERLTPEQRQIVQRDLAAASPDEAPASDDPRDLARSATRAELRQPGTLEQTWQRQGGMPGMAGGFLQTFAMVFLATSAANMLFGGMGMPADAGADPGASDTGAEGDMGGDTGDMGGDAGGWDGGGFGDFGGGDFGGDFGDF
jgi:hypothetical protein